MSSKNTENLNTSRPPETDKKRISFEKVPLFA